MPNLYQINIKNIIKPLILNRYKSFTIY